MGRRVQKKVYTYSSGAWSLTNDTLFVYDGWNLIQKLDNTGVVQKSYVWGLDLAQSFEDAGGIGGLIVSIDAGTSKAYYFQYDANGNVGQLVDESDGSIAAHYEYDVFGYLNYFTGPYADQNPFRFSTKYYDAETSLYYYGRRYYTASLGRWLNRDPIEEKGGLNLYGFVLNNPLNFIDPIGENTRVIVTDQVDGTATTSQGDTVNTYKVLIYKDGKLIGECRYTRDTYGQSDDVINNRLGAKPYGSYRETPPGYYKLKEHDSGNNTNPGKKIDVYEEVRPNEWVLEGPQGERTLIEFHAMGNTSHGCFTTADCQEIFHDLVIGDIRDPHEEATVVVMDRYKKHIAEEQAMDAARENKTDRYRKERHDSWDSWK